MAHPSGGPLRPSYTTSRDANVRRETFLEVGGFDESSDLVSVEDWHLWLRIAHAGGRFVGVPQPLTRYYRTPGNLTSDIERHLRAQSTMFERLLAAYPRVDEYRVAVEDLNGHLTRQYLRAIRDPMTPNSKLPVLLARVLRTDPSPNTVNAAFKSMMLRRFEA